MSLRPGVGIAWSPAPRLCLRDVSTGHFTSLFSPVDFWAVDLRPTAQSAALPSELAKQPVSSLISLSTASEATTCLTLSSPCPAAEPVSALHRCWRHLGHRHLPGPFVIEASPLDSAQSRRWRKFLADSATGDI